MFRYARSFFEKQVLETRSSAVNPLLEVVVVNGRKLLNSANVNYSYGSLQRVFEDGFEALGVRERKIEKALLLGCGGGSVLHLLAEGFAPEAALTAVDLDPVVLDLARKHFGLAEREGLELVEEDAALYVAKAGERFDLVVVDVFVDDEIPLGCQTPVFLRRCGRLLAPGGMLVYNRLYHTPQRKAESDAFAQVFALALGSARSLVVRANLLLVHERAAAGPADGG
jgi:spermidine synthase